MVHLISSDGVTIEISEDASKMSALLTDMLEDFDESFPVPINHSILKYVVLFCEFYSEQHSYEEISHFKDSFYSDDLSTLLEILNAADFLNVKKLVDEMCKHIASLYRNKTMHQLNERFGTTEFTREEHEEIRNQYPWAFI